jgi:hypothetical protein
MALRVARERGGLEMQAPPRFGLHGLERTAPHALADFPRGAAELGGGFCRAAEPLRSRGRRAGGVRCQQLATEPLLEEAL